MGELNRMRVSRVRGKMNIPLLTMGLLCYAELVCSSPAWPIFGKRNVQALAREGLLRSAAESGEYKRSISSLAEHGLLPTFRVPEDRVNESDQDEPIRLRNFGKRNTGTLARNGVKAGKRNIAALARNGYLKEDPKRNSIEDEYFYPFYQNSIPPVSEIDYPLDYAELYDLQQSLHPDILPPIEVYDKRNVYALLRQDAYNTLRNNKNYIPMPTPNGNEEEFEQVDKRKSLGLPNHGLLRPISPSSETKRYLSLPEQQALEYDDYVERSEKRSVDTVRDDGTAYQKRHIGALARLGWLPSFRYSGSRYSRSGRARFFMPASDSYRKYSDDSDFGVGERFSYPEGFAKADRDDTNIPPAAVPADTHSSLGGRLRPVSSTPDQRFMEAIARNRWDPPRDTNKFYNFRSIRIPRYRSTEKRYLLLPAIDNIMLRKTYPNNNLPSRRKNQ